MKLSIRLALAAMIVCSAAAQAQPRQTLGPTVEYCVPAG